MIRTRFAPSPSNFMHLGGARTALFNYLFAKSQGGAFVLRIDDTDAARNREEVVKPILDSLEWLGIYSDEGPYFQSERQNLYRTHIHELLESGKAYHDDGAIRLKCVGGNETDDLVRGKINWSVTPPDPVLARKDGSFLYNFATVIDDHDLKITHVLRAEEHLSNTPVQLEIYRAFGWTPPKFAHVPFVCAPGSKKKLSKRESYDNLLPKSMKQNKLPTISDVPMSPVFIEYYRALGYLPSALFNYLCLLGWSYDDKTEVMSPQEIKERFTIDRVVSHPASFDPNKLLHINSEHLNRFPTAMKAALILDFYPKANWHFPLVSKAVECCEGRMKVLSDFERIASFFFSAPTEYEEVPFLVSSVYYHGPFENAKALEEHYRSICDCHANIKSFSDFVRGLRLAITGKLVGPKLFESMVVLGEEECLTRINRASASILKDETLTVVL